MRVTRVVAGLTAVIAAVLGLSLATAGSAAAADEAGQWRSYGNTNPVTSSPSTWRCAGTQIVIIDVVAQVCAIRTIAGGDVQGAVIVRNNLSGVYSVTARMSVVNSSGDVLGNWRCPPSGVGANSWSVCFGKTFTHNGRVRATAGTANGVPLGTSPFV
ncbi:hypothetical protein SAMN05661093_01938 [Kibdelosporangium aridum]|uniref:Uncharacterized protein n=1 Tax=Kibdelosporangium aridum TaxID=2030 RepID=A0A1W2CEQ6_KIBAR|nr:hypothetical protein SAMN05661093_01938 [Kibdelosporangium aridum]